MLSNHDNRGAAGTEAGDTSTEGARMDANQQRIYERFRKAYAGFVEDRRRFSSNKAGEKHELVGAYDDPGSFLRFVELNFSSWESFEGWLEERINREHEIK